MRKSLLTPGPLLVPKESRERWWKGHGTSVCYATRGERGLCPSKMSIPWSPELLISHDRKDFVGMLKLKTLRLQDHHDYAYRRRGLKKIIIIKARERKCKDPSHGPRGENFIHSWLSGRRKEPSAWELEGSTLPLKVSRWRVWPAPGLGPETDWVLPGQQGDRRSVTMLVTTHSSSRPTHSPSS